MVLVLFLGENYSKHSGTPTRIASQFSQGQNSGIALLIKESKEEERKWKRDR